MEKLRIKFLALNVDFDCLVSIF